MWVIMLYPLLIWSFKKFDMDCSKLLKLMVFLTLATMLTVLCMKDSTDKISGFYILADTLKAVATIMLGWHLLKAFKTSLDSCEC
jgi:ethanolamine transporter EutH